MKRIITLCLLFFPILCLHAQDYPQWPADKPETGFIEASQSREIRIGNLILPQEADMQDKMRVLLTVMMKDASKKLGWQMVELSEYTNDNAMQGAATPYNLRSPRGIEITFQFIANKDSLAAWKSWLLDYSNKYSTAGSNAFQSQKDLANTPLYQHYQDSVIFYNHQYGTYIDKHKSEGAALFTTDKMPTFYLQKAKDFTDKIVAMQDENANNSPINKLDNEKAEYTRRFRNASIVQVYFQVNSYASMAVDQSLGPIESTSSAYSESSAKFAKLYTITKHDTENTSDKWNNVIFLLLGNFQTKPNSLHVYEAGFNLKGQGDEHTPKIIKSDKVQNISINIYGDKENVEKMVKLIDVDKLNSTIVKQ